MSQMKERMEARQGFMSLESQKQALEFYSGLTSEMEVEFHLDPNINPQHPMLLDDEVYHERFEVLPHFRFLINDIDNLRLLIKYLYVYIENQNGQSQRQKDFLISFTKYFFNMGLVKKHLDSLDMIELPEDAPELIKNTPEFYRKYESGELDDGKIFDVFFSLSQEDVVVNIGTNRKDFFRETIPMRPTSKDDVLESDPGDSDEEEKDSSVLSNKFESYIKYDVDQEFSKRVKTARFLPLFTDDQTLLYGTKHFYFLIRYFMTLYERLQLVKKAVAAKLKKDISEIKEENQRDVTKIEADFDKLVELRLRYAIGILFEMSKNAKEIALYEDCLRQLLGMQAYVLFTFDKAVSNFFRAISSLKNDNLAYESWKLVKKYEDSPVKYKEEIYYNDFIRIIPVGVENEIFFRFVYCSETGIIS